MVYIKKTLAQIVNYSLQFIIKGNTFFIGTNPMIIDILYYKTDSGESPFINWLESLDNVTQARIEVRLDRVRLGNLGDWKPISDGICELRLSFGAGYRIYFGKIGAQVILLLVGGDKKTQKKDIQKAIAYWKTFKENNL
jgi:putative addiction module killer protein